MDFTVYSKKYMSTGKFKFQLWFDIKEGTAEAGNNSTIVKFNWTRNLNFEKVNCYEKSRCDQMKRYIEDEFLDELMVFENLTSHGLNDTSTIFD